MELIKTKAWESLVIIKLIIGTGAGEQDGVGGGGNCLFLLSEASLFPLAVHVGVSVLCSQRV